MSEVRLIDANALKETAMVKFGDDITSITLFKIFEELIDNAPTVDNYTFKQVKELFDLNVQMADEIENLKRPQGEWITKGYEPFGRCNICDAICEINNFCGHCGAEMRGNQE